MEEPRLFRLAYEAGHLTFGHVGGQGWSLTVSLRRGDESWSDTRSTVYTHLSTTELVDVIEAEIVKLL
jgi:hypothetical protein